MNEKIELLSMQEAERKRIAEELHDTTVQDLVHLSQQLELANMYLNQDINLSRIELAKAKKHIKKIIEDMRGTIYDLRPMAFDDIGWKSAIEKLENDLYMKNDMDVVFDVLDIEEYDSLFKITVYRIIREACQNICKHAKANTMSVTMRENNKQIILSIKDDGIGIGDYDKSNHFGLSMIKEKVKLLSGNLSIQTNEKGTMIEITIPMVE